MEAVSFDDTLGMLRKVVGEDLNEDRTIPVCSEEMYEVIADFGRGLESDRTARVCTKYKTVDRKVKPVAAPLPEGSESRIRGVASDPSLRDPACMGHTFTDGSSKSVGAGSYCRRRKTGFGECSEGTGKPSHSHRKRSGA